MSHCLTLNNRFQNVMKHRWVLSKRRRGFAPCLKHEVFSSYGETPLYVSLLQNIEQATAKHYSVKMGHVKRNEISYTTATNTETNIIFITIFLYHSFQPKMLVTNLFTMTDIHFVYFAEHPGYFEQLALSQTLVS